MWLGAFVTYTLLMCPKFTQYQTHKHYIACSLKPWSPSASWVRGISMGGPIALWTKDFNGFCDVSCSPLQRFAWLRALSPNGTCSRPSDVAGKSFRENDFKIDYLFYTTNIGGPLMPPKLLFKLLWKKVRDMDMNLVLWIWSTRTQTKVLILVLTHFFSTRTRTHAKQSTRTCTQDLSTRPNPDRDLNQGLLHLWSKFVDPSLNRSWVTARTSKWLTDRQTDGQTDRQTDRQTHTHRCRQTTIPKGQNWPRVKMTLLWLH